MPSTDDTLPLPNSRATSSTHGSVDSSASTPVPPPMTSLARPDPGRALRLAVGYRNSADVEALRSWLEPTDIRLVSYDQSAQRLYDNSIRLDADCVLLSPDCDGYRHEIVSDLLFARAKPVPVIGWIAGLEHQN